MLQVPCSVVAGMTSEKSNNLIDSTGTSVRRSQRNAAMWVVVTDLDGTLMDDTYDLSAVAGALDALHLAAPQVSHTALATSKTLAELLPLALLCERPPILVFENGAGYGYPETLDNETRYIPSVHGKTYAQICTTLSRIGSDHSIQLTGFSDLSIEQLCELTGLTTEAAARAKQREASEPLLWQGSEEDLQTLNGALLEEQLQMVRGGRFTHVASPADKWDTFERWHAEVCPTHRVLACGDAPNDLGLLKNADQSIVFPGADNGYLLPQTKTTHHCLAPGADHWLPAVLEALQPVP